MYKATKQLEFNPENYKGEIIDEISETLPGQASTVLEVLTKFSNGTLGNIGLPTYYDYEEEIEITDDIYNSFDPTRGPDWDLSDAERYQRAQRARLEEEELTEAEKHQPAQRAGTKEELPGADQRAGTKEEEKDL